MMILNCPSCGCTSSLEVLLAFSEASKAFAQAIQMQGKLGKSLIKYLGLFRPKTRALSFERALKILQEIQPAIDAKQIQRKKQMYPAPTGAWIWAIEVILERRDQLDLPLKTHGYLYEVISSYKPEYTPVQQSVSNQVVVEKSLLEREQERLVHERQKHEKPAMSLAEMVTHAAVQKSNVEEKPHRALKGIPPNQLFAHLKQRQRDGETTEQCYQRLKALEGETQ